MVLRAGDAAAPVAARRGEFSSWIRREIADAWTGEWAEHDIRTADPLPGPRDADAFVITGSSSSVTDRAPWMLHAEALIRAIAAAGTPLFGICFGHQMIGQALGGRVAKNPRGREIGTVEVRVVGHAPRDPIFEGTPDRFCANHTHVDSVVELPPGARLLAQTDLEPHAAFAVGDFVKCVQFHPEIDGDAMRGYVEGRAHLIDAEGGDGAAILARVTDAPEAASTLRSFARLAAARALRASADVLLHRPEQPSRELREGLRDPLREELRNGSQTSNALAPEHERPSRDDAELLAKARAHGVREP